MNLPDEEVLAAARARLSNWPDIDQRFGRSSPAESKPVAAPPGLQVMDRPISVFAKRNMERAMRAKSGAAVCPKNNGGGHPWHRITREKGGVKTTVDLCGKCKTRRKVAREVVTICPGYDAVQNGRQSLERGGRQRWKCANCGLAESSHRKAVA